MASSLVTHLHQMYIISNNINLKYIHITITHPWQDQRVHKLDQQSTDQNNLLLSKMHLKGKVKEQTLYYEP